MYDVCLVSKVIELVKMLCTSEICESNPDEKFLTLPNIHKNLLKNISSKFFDNIMDNHGSYSV